MKDSKVILAIIGPLLSICFYLLGRKNTTYDNRLKTFSDDLRFIHRALGAGHEIGPIDLGNLARKLQDLSLRKAKKIFRQASIQVRGRTPTTREMYYFSDAFIDYLKAHKQLLKRSLVT